MKSSAVVTLVTVSGWVYRDSVADGVRMLSPLPVGSILYPRPSNVLYITRWFEPNTGRVLVLDPDVRGEPRTWCVPLDADDEEAGL